MGNGDPKRYYAVLGVLHHAGLGAIKSAYRRRAMELHPDRNPATTATRDFQRLNEAYAILSDPITRAAYDALSVGAREQVDGQPAPRPDPVTCSCCGEASAQRRYVVFQGVKSFIKMPCRAVRRVKSSRMRSRATPWHSPNASSPKSASPQCAPGRHRRRGRHATRQHTSAARQNGGRRWGRTSERAEAGAAALLPAGGLMTLAIGTLWYAIERAPGKSQIAMRGPSPISTRRLLESLRRYGRT